VTADVVVVGAGIVGAATTFELARRGVGVTLLDRAGISEGTTGLGEGNALCSDKDAGPELDLAVAGLRLFDELEELLGPTAAIRRKGALIVHPDERTWVAEPARAERLRAAGVDARVVEDVQALEPRLTGDVHGALHVPADLQCDPRAITQGLVALAREAGARVETGTEVAGLEAGGDGVRVAGADGPRVVRAGTVVLAAGPWSGPLAATAGLQLPVEPRKGQLTRLRLPAPDTRFLRHKVVDGSYLLSVTSAAAGRQISTVVETTAGGDVIVGSTRERCGFDPAVDDDLAAEVQARAARLVPEVGDLERAQTWVGFRPWLPDHLPAIGRSRTGPWVATGHEGSGVSLGPISGRLIAQAICGEEPDLDLAPFDPDRFADLQPRP
jgi:glycine/D-amino acid oxidase-like deaminating enzyme